MLNLDNEKYWFLVAGEIILFLGLIFCIYQNRAEQKIKKMLRNLKKIREGGDIDE